MKDPQERKTGPSAQSPWNTAMVSVNNYPCLNINDTTFLTTTMTANQTTTYSFIICIVFTALSMIGLGLSSFGA